MLIVYITKIEFKFNNIIILEYDINTIIDLDKTIIKENYEYIKFNFEKWLW